MTVPPPSASRPPWARSSVRSEQTQPVPTAPPTPPTPQDSVPQDAPYASPAAAPVVERPRWSGKKTAAVAAIALALTSAGAVVGAAATPRGIMGPLERDGRGGPGTSQNRQFGPGGGPGQGFGPGRGPGQQGQQGQPNPQPNPQGQQGQQGQQVQPNQPNQQGQAANT